MSSVKIKAPLGPREFYAQATPFLGQVLIFGVPGKTLALRKTDITGIALIKFLGHFFYPRVSIRGRT